MYYLDKDNFYHDELDSRPVMVTVRCITYNHEKFIKDALEGFLSQKTDFRFEVLVHDDCSTDRTAEIVKEYALKYPSIIKPMFEEENQYRNPNSQVGKQMTAHTRGKYVAMCEGDDYWIDPNKLQKQVDFLESHPDYVFVWSNAKNLNPDGTFWYSDCYPISQETPMEDVVIKGGGFMPTPTFLFIREIMTNWPPEGVTFHVGDYPLQIHAADSGKVYYMAEPMAVYRVVTPGSWSERTYKAGEASLRNYFNNDIELLERMKKLTKPNCHYYLSQCIILRTYLEHYRRGNYLRAGYWSLRLQKKYRPKRRLRGKFLMYGLGPFYNLYSALKKKEGVCPIGSFG